MKLIYTDAQNLFDEDADEMVAFDITPTDAQEIIRRVNAHDALVEALTRLALIIKGSSIEGLWLNHPELPEQGPLDLINAALAAASETRTEDTPDAKQGTQGGDSNESAR